LLSKFELSHRDSEISSSRTFAKNLVERSDLVSLWSILNFGDQNEINFVGLFEFLLQNFQRDENGADTSLLRLNRKVAKVSSIQSFAYS
jgi:hypothetical protein